MNMKKFGLIALAAASALATANTATAATLLDNVTCEEIGPGGFVCNNPSAIVGAGVEFNINGFFDVDFSAGQLTITALQVGTLSGTILAFTNLTTPWTSAALISGSVTNFDASDVTLNSGTLRVDFSDTGTGSVGPFAPGNQFVIALAPGGGAVPEPASWAMMVLGFGLIGATLRRRAAATPA